jgi:predicted membrane protein
MEYETMSAEERKIQQDWQQGQQRSKFLTGILVVLAGLLYLLKTMHFDIPREIFTWPVLLMCFGLITIVKHNYKTFAGWALLAVGAIYFSRYFFPLIINTKLIFPIIIICIGFSILFKSKNKTGNFCKKKIKPGFKSYDAPEEIKLDSEEYINSSTFFGGITKNIVTKDFKGASITTVFGGTEINMLRADFEETGTIDLTCVFGGLVLIVPSHWEIQSELVTIFGGTEDKREFKINQEEGKKILRLTGNCVFGGIEIKSFK